MVQPLVSIIIPVYNRENLIRETLDSVLAQSYQNWECIIVDDGSIDNTFAVIDGYCKKDKRFRFYIRDREPKGAPTCRNIGLENSIGEFEIFLDSDDILFSHALKKRMEFISKNPKLDFCVADGIKGRYPLNKENNYLLISTFKSKDVLPQFFNFAIPWNTLNPIYRRDALLRGKIIWDENVNFFQDINFHVKCVLNKLNFDYCNHEPDCLWREHEQGNIGNSAAGNLKLIYKQRLTILENFHSHPYLKKNDIIPLYARLMKSHIDINMDSTISNELLKYIFTNPFQRILMKPIFSIYLLLFKNRIPILRRVFVYFLRFCKLDKYFIPPKNEHFLKRVYYPTHF